MNSEKESMTFEESYHANKRWGAENLVAPSFGLSGDEFRELIKDLQEGKLIIVENEEEDVLGE